MTRELKILSDELRGILGEVAEELRNKNVTDRNLDDLVLEALRDKPMKKEGIKINFSDPVDDIYRVEAGRTPYDLLCHGEINGRPFRIFINNKFGSLGKNNKNDVTTYNNLLRLYLGIKSQRLSENADIDRRLVYRRLRGDEIVAYGLFVLDKYGRGYNFFLLEEIDEAFYVNPRNTMFQVRYTPRLRDEPLTYYEFLRKLIGAIKESLRKVIEKAEQESNRLDSILDELSGVEKDE
ncbi:hypothetical protein JCM16138_08550 [Thermococcus atlanticus]